MRILLGLVFYFWRIFASWQQKNKVIATHPKPLFGRKKKLPKVITLWGKKFEITRFRQKVPTCCQNIAGFLNFSTFLSNLSLNLVQFSGGWSPDHEPHKIGKKTHFSIRIHWSGRINHKPHKIQKKNTLFNTDPLEWKDQHLNIVYTSVACAIGPSVNPLQNRETQHVNIVFAMYVSSFWTAKYKRKSCLNWMASLKCYHVLNWLFVPKPGFLVLIWIFSSRIHLKINISHILNPNLTK